MISKVTRIQAHTSFITKPNNKEEVVSMLSFRKDQEFYALHYNQENHQFLVSTHYSVPFSRNSTVGYVPADCFKMK